MKIEFDDLITLINTVSASELTEFSMRDGDFRISMGKEKQEMIVASCDSENIIPAVKNSAVSGAVKTEEKIPQGNEVKAPLVGTYYSSQAPDADAFVKVGDTVKKGQTLGIIEAMKLMNEIECEYDGVVEAILVENGQLVEYGQPLFVIA